MKNKILILIVFLCFACADSKNDILDSSKSEHSLEKLSNNEDLIRIVVIESFIQKEILNGTFNKYKDYISDKLAVHQTYCGILSSYTHSKELDNYLSLQCERSSLFEEFSKAHPYYLDYSIEERLELKEKISIENNTKVSSEQAFEIFKNNNLTSIEE